MIGVCSHCGSMFEYDHDDINWDETGYLYSTKFIYCKNCQKLIIWEYEFDRWILEYPERNNIKGEN